MNTRVRWGILGGAGIALKSVIPGMLRSGNCEIVAIASRNIEKAQKISVEFGLQKFYGDYSSLLRDASVEAVYIPLPNSLHLEWTTNAAIAGKHVLCEKPVGLNAGEVRKLIELRDKTGVKIQEAFMVRTEPKWISVKEIVTTGKIGSVKAITMFFSYFNSDKSNIRNTLELGGGGLMDIGCYCVNLSRFIFDDEPKRVSGLIQRDSETGVDTLTSAMLDFPMGQATFTCSTQAVPYQRMQIIGTKGRIEIEIPVNSPPNSPTRIFLDEGTDLCGKSIETIEFPADDKFTIQGDLFSKAIRENSQQALTLEDSFANMAVIDAIFRSEKTGNWEVPEKL